jgi:hypothetical protein
LAEEGLWGPAALFTFGGLLAALCAATAGIALTAVL